MRVRSQRAARAALAVVEAAYRLEPSAESWLGELASASRPALADGRAVLALTFQITPDGVRTTGCATAGDLTPEAVDAIVGMGAALSPEQVRATVASSRVVDTTSAVQRRIYPGEPFATWPVFAASRAAGMVDSIAAKMVGPTGAGFMLIAPLLEVRAASEAEQARWRRTLTHVLAGLRLRNTLTDGDGDAVLHPDGRVVHAEGRARSRSARDALREAALRIDRARTRAGARDPDRALEAWRGLVSGRWSLVDRFDCDGRRLLVARRNEPAVPSPRALSKRERQVLAYAGLGYSNKHIGYALGLAPSTVSTHLRSAMRRLGVPSWSALDDTLRKLAREEAS